MQFRQPCQTFSTKTSKMFRSEPEKNWEEISKHLISTFSLTMFFLSFANTNFCLKLYPLGYNWAYSNPRAPVFVLKFSVKVFLIHFWSIFDRKYRSAAAPLVLQFVTEKVWRLIVGAKQLIVRYNLKFRNLVFHINFLAINVSQCDTKTLFQKEIAQPKIFTLQVFLALTRSAKG